MGVTPYMAQVLSILFFVVLALFGLVLYLIYGREPQIEEGNICANRRAIFRRAWCRRL
ncbi:MAG: hypothetical protein IPP40_14820 [bacterium]|nr:hypothetical protein [bacterium]